MPEETKKYSFPIPLQKGVIYGPVNSKRLGKSLGINLLPTTFKVCNFNCLYCFYGRTDFRRKPSECPPAEIILGEIESALMSEQEFDYITFSGNGAAVLHPDFPAIVRQTIAMRNEFRPGTPVAILSNSAGLERPEVMESLALFDLPIMKLDAGDAKTFSHLNRPYRGVKLSAIISHLKAMRGITLQTLLVDGEVKNSAGLALERWEKAVCDINPESVQVYSLDRDLPEAGLKKLANDTLREIAQKVEDEIGILTRAFVEQK